MATGLVSTSPDHDEETWDVKIRKQMIAPERVEEVRARLDIVRATSAKASDRPFLVPVREVKVSPLFLTLVADEEACLATLGERSSYTLLPRGVDERTAVGLLRHVCVAVGKLHACGITHSHLSAGTVVWQASSERVVLLGHLLPISLFTPTSPLGQVSRLCAAPEILRNEPYGMAADVWSIGVLLLQMVLPASKAFETADVEDTDLLSPLVSTVSTSGRSLLLQCLKSEPDLRPTIADLLRHPLFTAADLSYDGEGTSGHDGDTDDTSSEEEEEQETASEDATDSTDDDDGS